MTTPNDQMREFNRLLHEAMDKKGSGLTTGLEYAARLRAFDELRAFVVKISTAPPADRVAAAFATLEYLGYTYHDGEKWRPPLGKPPVFLEPTTLHCMSLSSNVPTAISDFNKHYSDLLPYVFQIMDVATACTFFILQLPVSLHDQLREQKRIW